VFEHFQHGGHEPEVVIISAYADTSRPRKEQFCSFRRR